MDSTDALKLLLEKRLQLYTERLPLAYVLLDDEFRIIDWNPAAEKVFGFAKEEMLGLGPPFEKLIPRCFWQQSEEILGRLRLGDMQTQSTNENLTKDGRTIICDWFNTPLVDDEGKFIGLVALAQDLTKQKLLEKQFHQSQKMEAVGRLAGGIAHDFNNLLTVILSACNFLEQSESLSKDNRELTDLIHSTGYRAVDLIRQLLAFSRRQILQPTLLNLNCVVAEIGKLLERLIGEDISLTTTLAPTLWAVNLDKGQIDQVLVNLAINARDAMHEGGKLAIETRNIELDTQMYPDLKPGPYVMLSVSDTGDGMDEETRGRIFEPFFTTKDVGKGSGLGLSTVFGIVKQSGGHATVCSEPGQGSIFRIYFPKVEGVSLGETPSPPKAPTRGTESILIVEDDDAVRFFACRILLDSGYVVFEARSGEEAKQIHDQHPGQIQLVLADVVMPNMSGRKLSEIILQNQPDMKFLFMSGYADEAVIRHGGLAQDTDFIQKPFERTTLANKVREVLDKDKTLRWTPSAGQFLVIVKV